MLVPLGGLQPVHLGLLGLVSSQYCNTVFQQYSNSTQPVLDQYYSSTPSVIHQYSSSTPAALAHHRLAYHFGLATLQPALPAWHCHSASTICTRLPTLDLSSTYAIANRPPTCTFPSTDALGPDNISLLYSCGSHVIFPFPFFSRGKKRKAAAQKSGLP